MDHVALGIERVLCKDSLYLSLFPSLCRIFYALSLEVGVLSPDDIDMISTMTEKQIPFRELLFFYPHRYAQVKLGTPRRKGSGHLIFVGGLFLIRERLPEIWHIRV